MDTSNYFITKEQYANPPTAVVEEVQLTQEDIETIRTTLLPRITKMIEEWGVEPRNTHRIRITNQAQNIKQ